VEQEDSNPRPLRCELDARQKRKCLPFPQLQHRRKSRVFTFFLIPYHRLTSGAVIFGHVLAGWNPKYLGASHLAADLSIPKTTTQKLRLGSLTHRLQNFF
jgi:hypothetical protein